MNSLKCVIRCVLAIALAMPATAALADSYPSKPIRLIVPTGAGSIADVAVRILAPKWSEFLEQPIVVVNRPGSGGVVASNQVAASEPDGYTLFASYDSITVALPFVQSAVKYTIDSFDYINGFGISSLYFMVRSDSNYRSLKDIVEAARRKPGEVSYSSYGIGVISHFTAQRLWDLSKVQLNYVPYKSSPDAAAALLSKDVELAVTAGAKVLGKNPQIRLVGVASDARRDEFPAVPTLKEQGYAVSLDFIIALIAPKGLPAEVKTKLTDAVRKANAKYADHFREQLSSSGDLSYADIPGAEVYRTWKERQAWFSETAPRMNLEKREDSK